MCISGLANMRPSRNVFAALQSPKEFKHHNLTNYIIGPQNNGNFISKDNHFY